MDILMAIGKLTPESGTLVFAICNLVVSAGLSIAGICLIIYALVAISWGPPDLYYISRDYLWIFFFSLCAAICLLFSVILLLGVVKRNKLLLKLYIIYGRSTIAVTSLFTLIYALFALDIVVSISVLFVLALYGLVLRMIRRLYLFYCKNPSEQDMPLPRLLQIIKDIFTIKANTLHEKITRCFALGNLSVAAVSFIIGICIVVFGIWMIGADLTYRYHYRSSFFSDVTLAGETGWTVVPLFFSSISLGFAILLANGLRERKSIQLKAYFIYGVVVETLSVFFAVLYVAISAGSRVVPTLVSLCLCGLYGYVLFNIHKTYKNFDTELNGVETDEEKALNYKQNILLQSELLNEKNKEDDLPRNDEVLVHNLPK